MKLVTNIAAIVLPLFLVLDVTAGELVERDYTINNVTEVHAGSGIRLKLTQGDTESLRLKAPAKMLKHIHVDLTNHKLKLNVDNDIQTFFGLFDTDEIVFTLVVKNLEWLDLSGGVHADIENLKLAKLTVKNSGGTQANFGNLQIKSVDIEASGGSEMEVNSLNSENVRLNISGGSEFEFKNSGTANTAMIDVSGGSNCKAKKMVSVAVEVVAGGGSDVSVHASKTLKVSAGGASNISYYGNPQVTSDIGGASDLNHMD